jgi:hypothetical protein
MSSSRSEIESAAPERGETPSAFSRIGMSLDEVDGMKAIGPI